MCLLSVGWTPRFLLLDSKCVALLTNGDCPIVGHGCTVIGLGKDVSERANRFSHVIRNLSLIANGYLPFVGRDAEGNAMSRLSWLQKIYWSNFGKPVGDRALFRVLAKYEIGSVLEIGVGNGARMRRLAKLAQMPPGCECLRYVGTDEFEAAQDSRSHMSLKQAHQVAGRLNMKACLIPGDLSAAVPRVAHKVGASDLIIVDGGIDPESPLSGPVGPWLNRIGHATTILLGCCEPGQELIRVDSSLLDLPANRAA